MASFDGVDAGIMQLVKEVCDPAAETELPETGSQTAPAEQTLADVVSAIQELKNGLNVNFQMLQQLTSASVAMEETLRKLQRIISTPNKEATTTPTKANISDDNNNGSNNEISAMGDDTIGSAGKRKAVSAELTEDDITNIIVSLSDDEDEKESKKTCRSTVTKMEKTLSIGKPELPSSWTRSRASSQSSQGGLTKGKGRECLYTRSLALHKVTIRYFYYLHLFIPSLFNA